MGSKYLPDVQCGKTGMVLERLKGSSHHRDTSFNFGTLSMDAC